MGPPGPGLRVMNPFFGILALALLLWQQPSLAHPGASSSIEHYSHQIEHSPENQALYISRGIAYSNDGRYDEALADFKRARTLGDRVIVSFDLGVLHCRMGKSDPAPGHRQKLVLLRARPRLTVLGRQGQPVRPTAILTTAVPELTQKQYAGAGRHNGLDPLVLRPGHPILTPEVAAGNRHGRAVVLSEVINSKHRSGADSRPGARPGIKTVIHVQRLCWRFCQDVDDLRLRQQVVGLNSRSRWAWISGCSIKGSAANPGQCWLFGQCIMKYTRCPDAR